MDWRERITIDPAVLTGKPVIRGTRIAVAFAIELVAQGWSEQGILANDPGLIADDVRACQSYPLSHGPQADRDITPGIYPHGIEGSSQRNRP